MHPDQIIVLVAQWIHSELERTEQAKAEDDPPLISQTLP